LWNKLDKALFRVSENHEPVTEENKANLNCTCSGYIEQMPGQDFISNQFYDDKLRFAHDMPGQYLEGGWATNKKAVGYVADTLGEKERVDNLRKWWTNEKYFFGQEPSEWNEVCGNRPINDQDRSIVEYF